MRIILYAYGIYAVVVGVLLCVNPLMGRKLADWWLKSKANTLWALVAAGVGILLIWAAPVSRAALFIKVLGWLGVLKGVYLLIAPRAQLINFMEWWGRLPQWGHRVWGLAALAIGAAVITTL